MSFSKAVNRLDACRWLAGSVGVGSLFPRLTAADDVLSQLHPAVMAPVEVIEIAIKKLIQTSLEDSFEEGDFGQICSLACTPHFLCLAKLIVARLRSFAAPAADGVVVIQAATQRRSPYIVSYRRCAGKGCGRLMLMCEGSSPGGPRRGRPLAGG